MVQKSWREKVDQIKERIHTITPEYQSLYGHGKILIPSAKDIESLIRQTTPGEILTSEIIRDTLSKKREVQVTDPMTTGIFLRIIAEAAEEERPMKSEITPYWRVLKSDGSINVKFPGGIESQIKFLEKEGHIVEFAKEKKSPKILKFNDKLVKNLA